MTLYPDSRLWASSAEGSRENGADPHRAGCAGGVGAKEPVNHVSELTQLRGSLEISGRSN